MIFIVEKWEKLSNDFKIAEIQKKFIYRQIPSLKKRFEDTDWPKSNHTLMEKFLNYMDNFIKVVDYGDSELWESFCLVIKGIESIKHQFPKKEIVTYVDEMFFFITKS
jgi:hypothetical protein